MPLFLDSSFLPLRSWMFSLWDPAIGSEELLRFESSRTGRGILGLSINYE